MTQKALTTRQQSPVMTRQRWCPIHPGACSLRKASVLHRWDRRGTTKRRLPRGIAFTHTFHKRPSRTLRRCTRHAFIFVVGLVSCPGFAEDWLQWGGPNGDFTVETKGLADKWPADGPRQLWKRPLGDGYSAILCKEGALFTAYRDGDSGVIVSLDAQTGATNWEHRYSRKLWADMRPDFGTGSNATPLIVGDRIVSTSIDGQVRCLDLASGKLRWAHDLPAEFGRRKRVEEYGYSNSPLPYKDAVIVQVGGDENAVVSLNPDDGAVVWKSDPGGVSYAPATITTLAGQDHFIYFSPEGVMGLDPSTGKSLWHAPIEFSNGNHLTPVIKCDDDHLWVSSQFTTGGGRLLDITRPQDTFDVKQLWFQAKLRGSCWTSIRVGDFIYGSIGGHEASFLAAFDWRTGKLAWRRRGFHMAQCLYADGKLLFLDQDGHLTIARVSPADLEVLDTAQVTEHVSWTLPTLVSTRLYLRDRKHILALDLSKE